MTSQSKLSLTSISTSDSVSLPPALLLYPVSESLHSLSKLHSDADLWRRTW